jgi:hypothetical protein
MKQEQTMVPVNQVMRYGASIVGTLSAFALVGFCYLASF